MTDILTYLYKFKALNLEQLSKLTSLDIKQISSIMKALEKQKLVEKVMHLSLMQTYYYLTKLGGQTLSPQASIKITRVPKQLDIFLDHRSKTNDFVIAYINILKLRDKDCDFSLDEHCYKIFNLNGVKYINPDAQIIYKTHEKQIVVFLELDRGTMELRNIKEKIIRYHKYLMSGEYKVYSDYLPLIAFVIDGGDARVASITKLIKMYFTKNDITLGKGFLITKFSNCLNFEDCEWNKIIDDRFVHLPLD